MMLPLTRDVALRHERHEQGDSMSAETFLQIRVIPAIAHPPAQEAFEIRSIKIAASYHPEFVM